jgi:hypothetical protein
MVVQWNEDPWQVATNFVISQAMPLGSDSECWRYNLAYDTLAESLGTLVPTEAMQLLERTSQGSTIWSLVYHLDSGAFDVVMSRDYDTVHRFKL